MKKLLFAGLSLALIAFGNLLFAQNPSWILAPNYVNPMLGPQAYPLPIPTTINQPGVPPFPNYNLDPFDGYDGKPAHYSANGISKPGGGLKFFVIDGFIYDGNGQYMCYAWQNTSQPNFLFDSNGDYYYDGNGGAEMIIIPHPTDCEKFILIGSEESNNQIKKSDPVYAIFDFASSSITKGGPWYSNQDINNGTNVIDELIDIQTSWPNGDTPITEGAWGNGTYGVGSASFATSKVQSDGSRFIIACLGVRLVILKMDSNGNLSPWKRFGIPFRIRKPLTQMDNP